ncbi:PLP-dependent transferase [Mycena pura]|uniref:PLP-dependent transferase n=1 Tax=Mycena pura TaxID=153505 RepID=A0AAD6YA94_9AGAR|nr:PLP-dependent transferase [Mycena pura]
MALPEPLPPSFNEFVSACFLGPRAENVDILQSLFEGVLAQHAATRENYHPEDGVFITDTIKESQKFQYTVDRLRQQVGNVSDLLNKFSVPFFSGRYMGHMCIEMSMPSMIGWLATILYNPNNVAFEASPVTTVLELEVGLQLCEMLGYTRHDDIEPWGHIAADGTIANMESMWYVDIHARNLKFYALSLHAAMTKEEKPLAFVAGDFMAMAMVTTCDDPDTPKLFSALEPWQLLNLTSSVVLNIADRLLEQYGITAEFLADALSPYLAQTIGKNKIMSMYGIDLEPQYFVPGAKHYSWPKAAALVGLGSVNCINVPVDYNARMDIGELRMKLQACVDEQRAVYAVVAVIGSTEEGAVDPLDEILALRPEFEAKGLSFLVHADAAWGGYFASMIRPALVRKPRGPRDYVPTVTLRESTVNQFKALKDADSITIDPHKSGYIPYPVGGLCYRDGRMRFLLTWSAPYLHQGEGGESIGIYGIEGSKPGAPAVACFLHHSVLGLNELGHGALLGQVSFTCRRFGAHWAAMSDETTDFIVVPFNPLEDESYKKIIRTRIIPKSNEEIVQDEEAFKVLCTLASDLNINAFVCNFRIDGEVNEDVEEANYLNKRVFDRLSLRTPGQNPMAIPLFLSSTIFGQADYQECVRNFQRRIGLETDSMQDLFVLRNVVMSPFQAAGNFVLDLATKFQEVLEEEVQTVVSRNTVAPQIHKFVMQGVDSLCLAYRPLFHHANGRHQLILHVEIPEPVKGEYQAARRASPGDSFILSTATETTIESILKDKSFTANISSTGVTIPSVSVSITEVVKNRPLNSRYRDLNYPASYTPFYLYGTPDEVSVDHMLLRAPNAQIASDLVTLDVQLTAEQLARGLIAHVGRPEAAMQPFTAEHMFFRPRASFNVEIFKDANGAEAQGPGLAEGGELIAAGTITLGQMVFVDCDGLNTEDFPSSLQIAHGRTTRTIERGAAARQWSEVVKNALQLEPHDGQDV